MATLAEQRRQSQRQVEVAGRLTERVVLSRTQLVDDGHGGWTEQPVALDPPEVFALIESLQGAERLQAAALEVALVFLVTLRWHAGVTAGTRITWLARSLDLEVNGPPVELGRKQMLQCYCSSRAMTPNVDRG